MDYAEFLALAAEYDSLSATLSGNSVALLLCLCQTAARRSFWKSSGEPLTDSQWDDIEAIVGQCLAELM